MCNEQIKIRCQLPFGTVNITHYNENNLPLDEVVASRAVFVNVSGSDGRKRFWNQLNNSKTVSYKPYVSIGS